MKTLSNYVRCAALVVFSGLALGGQADAQNANIVNYGKAPDWIVEAPQLTAGKGTPGAAFQFDYSDTQVRATAGRTETYTDYRVKILKPEALALGNLTLAWQPDGGSVTVHSLKIIRDGTVIDVLDKTRFRVIEREQNLDQASLDGVLTAVLQVPGLRVGDTFEFSVTIAAHDQTLGDFAFGMNQLPVAGMDGAFRYRLIWPAAERLSWQASKDLATPVVHTQNGMNEINIELRDPASSVPTDGAPMRYNIRRLIEYSGFADWNDLSRRMYPLFEAATKLAATSPVQAEIDRIKVASADPAVRMQFALSLVEDRIRYVYVGLNGENYRPATVDETWERRYGDCKSKTVLLLAILHGLDIQAEPVLVNSGLGDGIDEWLASPLLFNHVVVRAQTGSRSYWLDGTRIGDSNLDEMPPPAFRWVLPLRAAGAPIEEVKPEALKEPEYIENIDIDAREGFDVPAKVIFEEIFHNDQGRALNRQLEAMSTQDATQNLKSYANNGMWSVLDTADWNYDSDRNVLVLTFSGTWRLDAKGAKGDGWSYNLPGAGFYPPDERHRDNTQDQAAPWLIEKFPGFKCWTTTVRLPEAGKGWHWEYEAQPMNQRLAGTAYWRNAGLKDGIIRTVMSRNIYLPEITAAEASAVNDIIPNFNNNQSSVYEAEGRNRAPSSGLPFGDGANWDELSKSCSAH